MHTALTVIARLLPALAGAPPAAADTALVPVAAPLVMASTIN